MAVTYKKGTGLIVFTKELFIETMNEIKKQHAHDLKCSDAFEVILPSDFVTVYDNHWIHNQLVKILKVAFRDDHKDSWIEYYMWELDFGKEWKKDSITVKGKSVKLKTAEDLWELLNY